jgi:hypothetical protein
VIPSFPVAANAPDTLPEALHPSRNTFVVQQESGIQLVIRNYKNMTGSWVFSASFSDDTVREEKQILHDTSYTVQQPSKLLLLLLLLLVLSHLLADLLCRVEDT